MKLYAYQPTGHGQTSFFVMAKSTLDAFNYVSNLIDKEFRNKDGSLTYSAQGWGTEDYVLTVADEGIIIENDND